MYAFMQLQYTSSGKLRHHYAPDVCMYASSFTHYRHESTDFIASRNLTFIPNAAVMNVAFLPLYVSMFIAMCMYVGLMTP